MFGFDGAKQRGSKQERIDQLKRELKQSPHVNDIIKEIGKIIATSNGGKNELLDGLSIAVSISWQTFNMKNYGGATTLIESDDYLVHILRCEYS